jgi:hypothetical protein
MNTASCSNTLYLEFQKYGLASMGFPETKSPSYSYSSGSSNQYKYASYTTNSYQGSNSGKVRLDLVHSSCTLSGRDPIK